MDSESHPEQALGHTLPPQASRFPGANSVPSGWPGAPWRSTATWSCGGPQRAALSCVCFRGARGRWRRFLLGSSGRRPTREQVGTAEPAAHSVRGSGPAARHKTSSAYTLIFLKS